jgi:hypothetical protein
MFEPEDLVTVSRWPTSADASTHHRLEIPMKYFEVTGPLLRDARTGGSLSFTIEAEDLLRAVVFVSFLLLTCAADDGPEEENYLGRDAGGAWYYSVLRGERGEVREVAERFTEHGRHWDAEHISLFCRAFDEVAAA